MTFVTSDLSITLNRPSILHPPPDRTTAASTPVLHRLRSQSDNLHLGLMLALTFSTGVADAVGYLGLDKVFTGNMTGNVVILGMAIAGAVVMAALAIILFAVGGTPPEPLALFVTGFLAAVMGL